MIRAGGWAAEGVGLQAIYRRSILVAFRLYKALLSPLFGRRCRFLPTCSAYAAEVLIVHGPARGSWLAVRRVCRCHPFGGSGYDPPPARAARSGDVALDRASRAWKCEA